MKTFSDEIMKQSKVLSERLQKYPSLLENQKDKLDAIYTLIEECRAIHIYGVGRSGSAAVSLALRLKHFQKYFHYDVWFIGDVVKERIRPGDVVMLFSGSGETSEIVDIARRAKRDGAKVIGVTSYENSSLAKNSDIYFYLPGGLEKGKGWVYLEAQLTDSPFYGGGEFELMVYLFQETLITGLGKYKGIPSIAQEHVKDEVIS
jgi:6-phospho-3-hexuloisomerase